MSGQVLPAQRGLFRRWLVLCLLLVCGICLSRPTLAQLDSNTTSAGAVTGRLLYHPYVPKHSDGEQSTVEVLNVGLGATELSAQFVTASGDAVKTVTATLASFQLFSIVAAELADLPDGDYSLILNADGPLTSLVRVLTAERADSTIGGFGLYQGIAHPCIDLAFGPYYGGEEASQLALMNRTVATATVQISYFGQAPNAVVTSTLELPPSGSIQMDAPLALPETFVGMVLARSNRSLTGVLIQRRTLDGIEFIPGQKACTLAASSATQTMLHYPIPRISQNADYGGGPRLTTLFAGFPGEGAVAGNLSHFSTSGTPFEPVISFTLGGKEYQQFTVGEEVNPLVTARVTADRPLLVSEETDYSATSPYSAASYAQADADFCANRLLLPFVTRQPGRYSVLYVQNIDLDTASIAITFRDRAAQTVNVINYEIPSNGMQPFDLRQVSGLPDGFAGSVELFTPYRRLCAQVDEFIVGQPVTNPDVTAQTPIHLPAIFAP